MRRRNTYLHLLPDVSDFYESPSTVLRGRASGMSMGTRVGYDPCQVCVVSEGGSYWPIPATEEDNYPTRTPMPLKYRCNRCLRFSSEESAFSFFGGRCDQCALRIWDS